MNGSGEPGGGATAGTRPPKHVADRYDDRTAAMVASLYERDTALFGYELA